MRRSTVRFFAFVVLALLGAPLAMHVIMHDLHDHHDGQATACVAEACHTDHEHPIISSPAPQVPSLTGAAMPSAILPAAVPGAWTRITTAERNRVAHGSLRLDDDVGLQPVLSTYHI